MLKSQMIKTLTDSIEQDGDTPIGERAMIEMFAPDRLREYDAREQIVKNIVRAKRDLKAPMSCNFFADIWPKALAALMAGKAVDPVLNKLDDDGETH